MMISLGVIAIALFAVFTFILHTLQAKEAMRELELAKQAVTSKMEEIKAQSWENIPTFVTGQTAAARTVNGLFDSVNPSQPALMTITLQPIPSAIGPRIYDIGIRVNWRGANGTRTYRVNNLISSF
jgi:hypothetical protein